MATAKERLRNLMVNSVDLVDDGDNPPAKFVLFKRRHSPTNRPDRKGYDPKRRMDKQPTVGDVHVPSTGRDDDARRRRRPRRRPGAVDGGNHVAKLKVRLQEQESGGRSPHEHTLDLPDGPLSAGTFRSSRAQGHDHDVVLPDLRPGQSATVESGGARPDPPEGTAQHTHSTAVTAVELVQARREDLGKQETKKGRLEMFDRTIAAITKWAGRAPDAEVRKRLFEEVRADSQREQVVGVLMGRVGDLATSIREILFDPEGDVGDAQSLVKQSLGQFASGIDGELGEIFAGQIVKELADRDDPPDPDEVEAVLEKVFTDSSADPAGDEEEEGMDLSKLSKEEREKLESALEGAESVEDFLASASKIGELETRATEQDTEIVRLRRAVTGEKDPPEDPLEGLDPEVRKRIEPQLKAANAEAAKATAESADLRKRLDKLEGDTARSTFEKSVGDLTGLPQKREELVEMIWKVSDEADRETMRKNLEGAAAAARRGAFSEIGSGLSEGGSAYALIEAAAEEIRKQSPGMTEAVSKAKAMEAHPDLYDAYLEESGGVN